MAKNGNGKMPSISVNGTPVYAKKKNYSTGSRGFYVWGKVLIDGVPHQVNGNLIEIGSKPAPKK